MFCKPRDGHVKVANHTAANAATLHLSISRFRNNYHNYTPMQTSNPDLLFQTAHDQALVKDRSRKRAAAAHVGSPIEVGKVIDFVIDGPSAFVAESGWQARQVDLEVGDGKRI